MNSRNSYKVLVLLLFFCNSSILGTVSARVFKRDAELEMYPDWLMFKNEQDEKLEELAKVEPKNKPTKRLAPPANFILRAIAEPEGDDYYYKGQGESDGGEDYYEKKDWSDTNRPAEPYNPKVDLNHTNLPEIDGVANIITQLNPKTELFNKQNKRRESDEAASSEEREDEEDKDDENSRRKEKKDKEDINEEQKSEDSKEGKKEDNVDYEEENSEKQKSELSDEEKRENEAKKARILESVDALKARHAQEQRFISEKVKEEEMYQEEFERDKIKYNDRNDKYASHPRKTADYNDFDEGSQNDKYKINHSKPSKLTKPTTRKPKRLTTIKPSPKKTEKHIESGKLSVFKNPRAYMVYDDEDDSGEKLTKTTKAAQKPTRRSTKTPTPTTKYSSKYSTPHTDTNEETVRISLVPEDNEGKAGEPTMFFPKRRSNKRRRKQNTTTPPPDDTSAPEPISVKELLTALDAATNSSPSAESASSEIKLAPSADESVSSEETSSTADITGPSALDSATSAAGEAPSAVDVITASSDNDEHKKGDYYHHEKGEDREHHSESESSHEEHGKKSYKDLRPMMLMNGRKSPKYLQPRPISKPWYYHYALDGVHEDTKTEKGYHDKEDHLGKYKDHGGVDKHHEDEKKHYGAHHHEEHGKKEAKYEESGKHSKGHSTKGSHDIHKKEEYEKNIEFFEEDGDSSDEEKHGGHSHERSHSSGGNFKKGNLNAAHHGNSKGESGHFQKGGREYGQKGQSGSAGHERHAKHGNDQHSQGGNAAGKKWIYHHGNPAKTANLVVIDRRGDQYYHGPQYYG